MRLLLITAVCFCTVISAPAPLPLEENFNLPGFNTKQENHEERFLRVDHNKDKQLDFSEFLHMELAYVEAKKEEFDSLDKNRDGIVTLKEYEEHYHGVTSRSEARRTEYFAGVFRDFDEDFDMSLNQDEIERLLAERFLVKPRENFPKLFFRFDQDHSGGLDLTEYMKFDSSFPFDQTDPISADLMKVEKSIGRKSSSNRGKGPSTSNAQFVDAKDAQAIAWVMAEGKHPVKAFAPTKADTLPTLTFQHRSFTDDTAAGAQFHPVQPGPTRPVVPIIKLVKATKAI